MAIQRLVPINGFDFTKAATYDDLVNDVLRDVPPGWTEHELGEASDGNVLYGYSFGSLSNQPTMFIQGTIHGGHEWRCAHWVARFRNVISESPYLHNIRNRFSFFILPCLNPFGYVNNSYNNANGVNLNRNWDYNFDVNGDGPYPFSEPETAIVRDLVLEYRPILFIDAHTWGSRKLPEGYQHGWGPRRTVTMQNLHNSLALTTGVPGEYTTTANDASANNWAAGVTAKDGVFMPLSAYFEPAGGESEEFQSRVGLNALLMYCLFAAKMWRRRTLTPRFA